MNLLVQLRKANLHELADQWAQALGTYLVLSSAGLGFSTLGSDWPSHSPSWNVSGAARVPKE